MCSSILLRTLTATRLKDVACWHKFTTNRLRFVVLYIRYVAGNRWYLYYASPSSQFILTNVRSEYNYIYKIGEVCHSWAVRSNFMNETTPSKARKNGCGVSRPVKMSGLKRFAPRLVLVQAHVIDYCTFSTCFHTKTILIGRTLPWRLEEMFYYRHFPSICMPSSV